MPLKILHPKNNAKHRQKLIVIQGKCDNAQKVSAVLINKAAPAQQIAGQKLGNNKRWGFLYKNLVPGNYKFTVSQTNSPIVTDTVDFEVNVLAPPPPPVVTPPTITAPSDGEEVATGFYPYGVSAADVSLAFAGNGQSTAGTVTQQPDIDGNWVGAVEGLESWPSGAGYQLTASNSSGSTNVNNLTITTT